MSDQQPMNGWQKAAYILKVIRASIGLLFAAGFAATIISFIVIFIQTQNS